MLPDSSMPTCLQTREALHLYLTHFLCEIRRRLEGRIPLPVTPCFDLDSLCAPSAFPSPPARFQNSTFSDSLDAVTIFPCPNIAEALRHSEGRLAVVGAEGSGKTMALLQAAERMAEACLQDRSSPVPIWAELSTWDRREALLPWALAGQGSLDIVLLTESGRRPLVFFLEGLDELETERPVDPRVPSYRQIKYSPQLRLLEAIRELPTEWSVVVSCRTADFEALDSRAWSGGVLELLPLPPAAVWQFLSEQGPAPIVPLRAQNEEWQENSWTPLKVTLASWALTTRGKCAITEPQREPEIGLFDNYIRGRFELEHTRLKTETDAPLAFTEAQTRQFLGRIACRMWQDLHPAAARIPCAIVQELLGGEADSERFVAFAARLGFLAPVGEAEVAFLHRSLRDACAIPILVAEFRLRNTKWHRSPTAESTLLHIGLQAIPALVEAFLENRIYSLRGFIRRLGAQAEALTPLLIPILQAGDQKARLQAASLLQEIGAHAGAATPVLIQTLNDPDKEISMSAAEALAHIRPEEPALLWFLLQTIPCEEYRLTGRALKIVCRLGAKAAAIVPTLLRILQLEESWMAHCAIEALGKIGPQYALMGLPLLRNRGRCRRSALFALLQQIGPHAVPDLLFALEHYGKDRQLRAIVALGEIGPAAREAVPALLRHLAHQNQRVRSRAARALGKIGAGAAAALPDLRESLSDNYKYVRISAAFALGNIGPQAKEAVPKLIQALQDPSEHVRMEAAAALGKIGLSAATAIPSLLNALDDSYQIVRTSASAALSRIGMPVMPHLLATIPTQSLRARREAASVLQSLGAEAIGALLRALPDQELPSRRRFLSALGRIGAEALPVLLPALQNSDPVIRAGAVCALGRIGPTARMAAPLLLKMLQEKDAATRRRAAHAMRKIAPNALPAFLQSLDSSDTLLRLRVLKILEEIGSPALPALMRALQESDEAMRLKAACALHRMGFLRDPSLPTATCPPGIETGEASLQR